MDKAEAMKKLAMDIAILNEKANKVPVLQLKPVLVEMGKKQTQLNVLVVETLGAINNG